jgi:uncharacterized protein YbjT (DUF2867 family)
MSSLILVVGATGTVGSHVVDQLLAKGEQVRVLTRDLSNAAKFGDAVEIVQADLEKPDTLRGTFSGATKVFVLSNGPEQLTHEVNAFAAAQRAGVGHIVKLSALESFQGHLDGTEHGDVHRESEGRLRTLGPAWTMLRPGFFASNFPLYFLRKTSDGAAFYLPTSDGKEAPIDERDIAAAAVATLTSPGHEGKIYELTGPDLLSNAEMADRMSAATGISIRHADLTETEARERFLADGFPPGFADSVVRHFAAVKAGKMHLTSGIPDLLGRPARSFDDWLAASGALFAPFATQREGAV